MKYLKLTAQYIYDAKKNHDQIVINNISHIDGPWIQSAENITYKNNVLCANLRSSKIKFYDNYGYSNSDKYSYDRDCTPIENYNKIWLKNVNGKFVQYHPKTTKETYSQVIGPIPKGPWLKNASLAKSVSFFPNAICAEFFIKREYYRGASSLVSIYEEDCIEYSRDDILDYINEKFVIVGKQNSNSNYNYNDNDNVNYYTYGNRINYC